MTIDEVRAFAITLPRSTEGLVRGRVKFRIGSIVFLAGFVLSLRFLYYYLLTPLAEGKIQSLILSAVLMIVGFQVILIGLVADVLSNSRKLLEDLLYRVRRMELDGRSGGHRNRGDD